MIDLHTHTTASDGVLSPAQLVKQAAGTGLAAIAITDHDTLDGVAEARAAGERHRLRVIAGVEISVDFRGPSVEGRPGWMHLLLYFSEPGGPVDRKLAELKQWRSQRNQMMAEKLRQLGYDIRMEEVAEEAGGGQVGRPHFARVLEKKGLVASFREAFDRLLAKGGPAYVDKKRLDIESALKLAREENAVPVLAHPYSLGIDPRQLGEWLSKWRTSGLGGVEVIYPEHGQVFRDTLSRFAQELGLVQTGGTDFHGQDETLALGSGRDNNVLVPDEVLDRLLAARR